LFENFLTVNLVWQFSKNEKSFNKKNKDKKLYKNYQKIRQIYPTFTNTWTRKFFPKSTFFGTFWKKNISRTLRFLLKLGLLTKSWIFFWQNFDLWTAFRFFEKNFDFWAKFRFLTKISIFDQNFNFWTKFRFFTNIPIFDQNFDFWPKLPCFITILIFDGNFDFWPKLRFLTENKVKLEINRKLSFSKFYQFSKSWYFSPYFFEIVANFMQFRLFLEKCKICSKFFDKI